MYISARIPDSNEIPTATPLFPGSGNTDRLLGVLSYVLECHKSNMSAFNYPRMAIVRFQLLVHVSGTVFHLTSLLCRQLTFLKPVENHFFYLALFLNCSYYL